MLTIVTPTVRTAAEIEALQANWASDPCWDIEDTEGFEAHHAELLAYRLAYEERIEADYQRKLEAKAAELGLPGNVVAAGAFLRLEQQLRDQAGTIANLRDALTIANEHVAVLQGRARRGR